MIQGSSLLLLATFVVACSPPPPPVPGAITSTGTPVVVVNGQNITQEMVDAQLKQLPDEVRTQLERSGGLGRVKDNLIAQELLYQEALKRNMQSQPDMTIPLALAERQVLAQAVLNQVGNERLTDDRIQQWYNDHLVQFSRPQANLSMIVVADEAAGKDIVTKLKGGADFAELAKSLSLDKSSGADGGNVGWLSQRELRDPKVATPVFAANKGDVIGPLQASNGKGWQIFKVNDKRDKIPLDEVKDQVRSQAQREVLQGYIDELEKAANIERKDAGDGGAPAAPGAPGGSGAPAMPAMPPANATPAAPAAPGSGG